MSKVMQAICPGCKSPLRVPGKLVREQFRCSGCGAVMRVRQPAPVSTSVTAPTPLPIPLPRSAPPVPPALPSIKTAPLPVPAPVAPPVASPVALARPGQAFDFDQGDEVPSPSIRTPRHRRSGGIGLGGWITIGVALLILGGGGLGIALNWKQVTSFAANSGDPSPEPEKETPRKGKAGGKGKTKVASHAGFPRRALLISVHNYLYMNPITAPPHDKTGAGPLARSLNLGLNIPLPQITELSDAASTNPRPPLKSVIETTIKSFLQTSRKQDRVILLFAGHTVEADGKAYLIPLEGEKDNIEGLIPVAWVMDQLAKADVKQKILIIDGNRKNSAQGEERPLSGEMTEGFEKALSKPPAGVQVWASCGKGQLSHEFDDAPLGLFLDSFRQSMRPDDGGRSALEGQIQQPEDPIPLERFQAAVDRRMADTKRKAKQKSILFGKANQGGAPYDAAQAAASPTPLPAVKGADQKLVSEVLAEISLPSLKGGEGTAADLEFGNLPPFPAEVMKKYDGELPMDSKLRQAVRSARATLWSISTSTPPAIIKAEVEQRRTKLKVDLSILRDRYGRPGAGPAEQRFKASFSEKSRGVARIVALLEDELDRLKEAGSERETAPPRWQANYDYVLARFQAQLAYLEQYNNLLGQMQKELPPIEAIHSGWRVASNEKASDSTAKRYEKPARKLYAKVAEQNAKTPWEVLAKREKLTALGMEWQAY